MEYKRVEGKTYTLFGDTTSTEDYYTFIRRFVDNLQTINPVPSALLKQLQVGSGNQRAFNRWKRSWLAFSSDLRQLDIYTQNANRHLKSLSAFKLFDKRLRTKEWQYHLFMLEAELTNRLNKKAFLESDFKMALLPYCLHDLKKECKSSSDGIEYVCRSCSKECYINTITRTLSNYNVKGYLWMQSNLKTILKKLLKDYKTIGILGIACIPELINGMRSCAKHGIPAVGIPLDANRCIRWMGSFHDNSVNIEQLNKILSPLSGKSF